MDTLARAWQDLETGNMLVETVYTKSRTVTEREMISLTTMKQTIRYFKFEGREADITLTRYLELVV